MIEKQALNNPMVKISLEGTIELLKDYIASEPLGKAIIKFQKKNPVLCQWDPNIQDYSIWRTICKKAAQKIMEEIHKQVGSNLAGIDDSVVDKAISKIIETANRKIKIDDNDAIFFAITENPLPPKHPLSMGQSSKTEKLDLFGENIYLPENN